MPKNGKERLEGNSRKKRQGDTVILFKGFQFKSRFGFWATKPRSEFFRATHQQEQQAVEAKLHGIAEDFQRSCSRQSELTQKKITEIPGTKEWSKAFKEHRANSKQNAWAVKHYKTEFWEAHELAEKLCFEVKGKVGDYYTKTK